MPLHDGGGELEALALAPLEADIVPVGHLVLVDADGARAGVGAGVELGDAADGDAGLRDGVLGEGPHLLEHPLGGADALADEDLVRALLAAARRLEALLLVAAALDADELARHQRRDRRAQQGPPRVHHGLASLRGNRGCTDQIWPNPPQAAEMYEEIVRREGGGRSGELGSGTLGGTDCSARRRRVKERRRTGGGRRGF